MATRRSRTMCPMNCHPTFCGMMVETDGDRLLSVAGDKENPDSEGFLCIRGKASKEIIGNPKRLLHPMARVSRDSDEWLQISWDEAFDRIAASIESGRRDETAFWPGHGAAANDFGLFAHGQLAMRLALKAGFQFWDPIMICWGLGALGIGLTGPLEVNTKEDMSAHSDLILLWGSNFVSQPNTARHVAAAKKRGARVVTIDIRQSEACGNSDEVLIVRPGTDAALALGIMHVIVNEGLTDGGFIANHTVGFDQLRDHLQAHTPEWAESVCGVAAERIAALARDYARTEKAMICLSGSSMYKNRDGWEASRAISCLPALTGKLGKSGAGLGPRHGADPHGSGLNFILNPADRPAGDYVHNQMSDMIGAIEQGRIRTMLLFGSNMLSSFSDAARLAKGFAKMDLVVCQDLFMNDTMRRHADIVLPATAWLEDVGCKRTATHIYLMDQVLPPAGEARSMTQIVRSLAERLGIEDFYPWEGETGHIDAVLDHPSTRHATVAKMREAGGIWEQDIGHVAHPELAFPTPSGKIEFYSQAAEDHGLSPLPSHTPRSNGDYPLELRMSRTINHFHSFYDSARALPTLVQKEPQPTLWISPADAGSRAIADGDEVSIKNARGTFAAHATVTDKVPAGTLWIHDGWPGLNALTEGAAAVSDEATRIFAFSTGQSSYESFVEVARA